MNWVSAGYLVKSLTCMEMHRSRNQKGGRRGFRQEIQVITELHKCTSELSRDFPGGPVVKTPHSQCRGPGFDPWSGN